MSPACLPPAIIPASAATGIRSVTQNRNSRPPSPFFDVSQKKPQLLCLTKCRASSPSSSSLSITDFDLYELLGVHGTSDQSRIKAAYRTLQKRCHPDIAGPKGHDMAIILNEAYSVLTDPVLRSAYDKEQAKLAELKGYTGKPIYSVWSGSETEHRAVFVDEVKCVGCLKCALCAEKTFAVETVYGRARVVNQWADPETKIQEAIDACPVDCISVVERSDLASLEFLMSKQPRGNVRVGAGNAVGTRVSNIFVDVKKFQERYAQSMSKTNRQRSQETDLQRDARMTAVQAIRAISNWLYWQSPGTKAPESASQANLTYSTQKWADPDIKKLQDAAAARKQARQSGLINQRPSHYIHRDEYWIPSTRALPPSENSSFRTSLNPEPLPLPLSENTLEENYSKRGRRRQDTMLQKIPIAVAALASFIVHYHVKDAAYELKEHIGGSLALSIVNSPWLQVLLAGFTWYFIGSAAIELVEAAHNKQEDQEA